MELWEFKCSWQQNDMFQGLEPEENSVIGGQRTQCDHNAGHRVGSGRNEAERWGAGTRSEEICMSFLFSNIYQLL